MFFLVARLLVVYWNAHYQTMEIDQILKNPAQLASGGITFHSPVSQVLSVGHVISKKDLKLH